MARVCAGPWLVRTIATPQPFDLPSTVSLRSQYNAFLAPSRWCPKHEVNQEAQLLRVFPRLNSCSRQIQYGIVVPSILNTRTMM